MSSRKRILREQVTAATFPALSMRTHRHIGKSCDRNLRPSQSKPHSLGMVSQGQRARESSRQVEVGNALPSKYARTQSTLQFENQGTPCQHNLHMGNQPAQPAGTRCCSPIQTVSPIAPLIGALRPTRAALVSVARPSCSQMRSTPHAIADLHGTLEVAHPPKIASILYKLHGCTPSATSLTMFR